MEVIQQFRAEDGSIWPSEKACRLHEIAMRGDQAPMSDVAYLVADVDGNWRAYKKSGGSIRRIDDFDRPHKEAYEAYETVLRDIGYPVHARTIDEIDWFEEHDELYFPRIEDFPTGTLPIGTGNGV